MLRVLLLLAFTGYSHALGTLYGSFRRDYFLQNYPEDLPDPNIGGRFNLVFTVEEAALTVKVTLRFV